MTKIATTSTMIVRAICENCDHSEDCYEGNPDAVLDEIAQFTHIDDDGREVDMNGNIVDDEDDDNLCDNDYNCTGCPHEDECEEKYNPYKEKEDAKSTETTDDTVLPY